MKEQQHDKIKVLMIQGSIPQYRVPVLNLLSKSVALTVVYSTGAAVADAEFASMKIPYFMCHYKIHKKNIRHMASKFDVVICTSDMSLLYAHLLKIRPRSYRLIYWGIGVSASYNERYDQNPEVAGRIAKLAQKSADAMLFYSDYPIEKYAKMGVERKKLFAAHNTVYVLPSEPRERDIYLFVGSLYRQKKIDCLMEGYYASYKNKPDIHPLVIVGDGDEKANCQRWIDDHGLHDKITLVGAIYNEEILKEYFSRAILCISPDQAGLSVLKSMGYGTPFVTHRNAITGGEIFNIENGINGVLLENLEEISDILTDAEEHPKKYLQMGENAKDYYWKHRQISDMVDGFLQAIAHSLK